MEMLNMECLYESYTKDLTAEEKNAVDVVYNASVKVMQQYTNVDEKCERNLKAIITNCLWEAGVFEKMEA